MGVYEKANRLADQSAVGAVMLINKLIGQPFVGAGVAQDTRKGPPTASTLPLSLQAFHDLIANEHNRPLLLFGGALGSIDMERNEYKQWMEMLWL